MVFKRMFYALAASFILLLLFIFLGSAPLITQQANKVLAEQGLMLKVNNARINPFTLNMHFNAISLSSSKEAFVQVERVAIDVDFWQLLAGKINIASLEIEAIKINADYKEQQLSFAGWQMPNAENDSAVEDKQVPSSDASWPISIEHLVVLNSKFELVTEVKSHHWQVQQFAISDFQFSAGNIRAAFNLSSQLNQEPLMLGGDAAIGPNGQVVNINNFAMSIELADAQPFLPPEFTALSGKLNANSSLTFTSENEQWIVNQRQSTLTIDNGAVTFLYQQQPLEGTIEQLSLSLGKAQVSLIENQPITGAVPMTIRLDKLAVKNRDTGDVFAMIERIREQQSELNLGEKATFVGQALTLEKGQLSKVDQLKTIMVDQQTIAPLLDFRQITLDKLSVDATQFSAQQITADVGGVTIYKSKSHSIENLPDLLDEEGDGKENRSEPSPKETFKVAIDNILVTGEPTIVVYDHTPAQMVTQEVKLKSANVTNLTSHPANSVANFQVSAAIGKRTTIDVSGALTPFAATNNLQAKGNISELNLVPYSPYVISAINHKIKHGRLSADFNFAIKDQQISGEVNNTIKGIALSDQQVETSDTGGTIVPLNVAINQLTDDQGNLSIKLPLSGNINDPNFGLSGFVAIITTKALKEAAKSYMIQTFLPYSNIINIAMYAGNTLFEININDLDYQAKQLAIEMPQQTFAEQLKKVLTDKERIQITVCPIVIPADIGFVGDAKSMTSKQKSTLERFGQQRLDTFVDHLVDDLGISHERVIGCGTEIDFRAKAVSRLSFSAK